MFAQSLNLVTQGQDSGSQDNIDHIDQIQDKAIRTIEYCINRVSRTSQGDLKMKYDIESLFERRKRSLLKIRPKKKIGVFRYLDQPYIIAPTLTFFFRVFRAFLPKKKHKKSKPLYFSINKEIKIKKNVPTDLPYFFR